MYTWRNKPIVCQYDSRYTAILTNHRPGNRSCNPNVRNLYT